MEIKIYAKDSTYEDQFLANFSTSFHTIWNGINIPETLENVFNSTLFK